MKATKPKTKLAFASTRRALSRIKEPSIRKDFAMMVDGIEFCLASRRRRAALRCANIVVGMAVGLNRTISPRVAVGILDGLLEDGKQDAVFLQIGGSGFTKHKDQRCDVDSSQCLPKKGSNCWELSIPGCGGNNGFSFPWLRGVVSTT